MIRIMLKRSVLEMSEKTLNTTVNFELHIFLDVGNTTEMFMLIHCYNIGIIPCSNCTSGV